MPPPRSPSPDLSDVALAVLAGGQGTRMGRPKATLLLNGKPILHALLDRIAWPGPTLLSVAAESQHPPGSERFTHIIPDSHPGQGPLQGLHDVLAHSPVPSVVVIPIDMPHLRQEHLAWLVAQLKARPGVQGLMLARKTPAAHRPIEPFPCAFHQSFAPAIAVRLQQNIRALHKLADDPSVETIPAPGTWPDDSWTNLNTPEDLALLNRPHGERAL